MINENVKKWLYERGFGDRLSEHDQTIDTVEHAAQQIGCSEAEIAKTLSFLVDDKPVILSWPVMGALTVPNSKHSSILNRVWCLETEWRS